MAMTMTLSGFVALLKQAPKVTAPSAEVNWQEHIDTISVAGRIAAVTERDYDHWLDVLFPRWLHGSHFCTAEGADPFRLFWRDRDGQHWCRQLTGDETDTFCRLAGFARHT